MLQTASVCFLTAPVDEELDSTLPGWFWVRSLMRLLLRVGYGCRHLKAIVGRGFASKVTQMDVRGGPIHAYIDLSVGPY